MLFRKLAALLAGLLLLAACEQDPGDAQSRSELSAKAVPTPSIEDDLSGPIKVEITTNKGVMTGQLYPEAAPLAVSSFVSLAEREYFDGLIFHRIVPGFVVQTGDPTGTGGGGPGYSFADEPIPSELTYSRGTIAMANSGPDTNGSQFFICLADLPDSFPRNYTIFGQIEAGFEVLDELAAIPLTVNPAMDELSKPTAPALVESIRIER